MIAAKLPPPAGSRRGSFAASITYAAGQGIDRPAWIELRNVLDIRVAATEMDAVAAGSRCVDPVVHWTISYAPDEQASPDDMRADAGRLLDALGLAEHQAVVIAHADTAHAHLHVVASRVSPATGKAVSMSHDFARGETAMAAIAFDRDWTMVPGFFNKAWVERQRSARGGGDETAREPTVRRRGGRERARYERSGELPWADTVRPVILTAMSETSSWRELIQRLASEGILLKHLVKGSGPRRFHGLAFADGDHDGAAGCSASAISPECRYIALATRFGPWPDIEPSAPAATRPSAPRERARSRRSIEAEELKSGYDVYLTLAKQQASAAWQAARATAWAAEQHARRREIDRLYDRRRLATRAARASLGRGAIAGLIVYLIRSSFDRTIRRCRAAAQARWQNTRSTLVAPPRPMRFRVWAEHQAALGYAPAQRACHYWISSERYDHTPAPPPDAQADLGHGAPAIEPAGAATRRIDAAFNRLAADLNLLRVSSQAILRVRQVARSRRLSPKETASDANETGAPDRGSRTPNDDAEAIRIEADTKEWDAMMCGNERARSLFATVLLIVDGPDKARGREAVSEIGRGLRWPTDTLLREFHRRLSLDPNALRSALQPYERPLSYVGQLRKIALDEAKKRSTGRG